MAGNKRVVAVLGPTNTGKTTYAIERMLAHRTGVIGLPLLNRAMHPRQGAKVADPAKLVESRAELPARETPAQRLDDSRILGLALVAMAGIYLFNHFANRASSSAWTW